MSDHTPILFSELSPERKEALLEALAISRANHEAAVAHIDDDDFLVRWEAVMAWDLDHLKPLMTTRG